jgi:hypothetical protein
VTLVVILGISWKAATYMNGVVSYQLGQYANLIIGGAT